MEIEQTYRISRGLVGRTGTLDENFANWELNETANIAFDSDKVLQELMLVKLLEDHDNLDDNLGYNQLEKMLFFIDKDFLNIGLELSVIYRLIALSSDMYYCDDTEMGGKFELNTDVKEIYYNIAWDVPIDNDTLMISKATWCVERHERSRKVWTMLTRRDDYWTSVKKSRT